MAVQVKATSGARGSIDLGLLAMLCKTRCAEVRRGLDCFSQSYTCMKFTLLQDALEDLRGHIQEVRRKLTSAKAILTHLPDPSSAQRSATSCFHELLSMI